MKKFITYIAQQPENQLVRGKYKAVSNEKLNCDFEASFPVLSLINGYTSEEDEIEIVAIYEKENENCQTNMTILKNEMKELGKAKKLKHEIKEIIISGEETYTEQLHTFEKLLNAINEGDELYVCATYGTKPVPIIEMMVMNAAVKLKRGISVACVAYGRAVRGKEGNVKDLLLYDITPLFLMSQLVDSIAENPVEDAEAVIRRVLEEKEDD